MTAQDPATAMKIARLMRAARKRQRLTQQSVASRLGVSQGALSKMENGYLIPSAPQWFEFCDMTGVDPVSLKHGFIDRVTEAVLEISGDVPFKMPKNFLNFRASKVRNVKPMLDHFQRALGEKALAEYLKHIKVDADFFVEFDNQLNFEFPRTLIRAMMQKGAFSPQNMPFLSEALMEPSNHGLILQRYIGKEMSTKELVRTLLADARYYECNFDYRLEDESSSTVSVSVTPQEHLQNFNFRNDPDLEDFYCRYIKEFFNAFAMKTGNQDAELREHQCMYRGADRCVYEISG